MGSRILSPHVPQHWKANRQERVLKRPRKGSVDQAIALQNCAENPFLELNIEVLQFN